MKFHQLAERNREIGHQFNHRQFTAQTITNSQASDMLPIKQQVTAGLNQHLLNLQLQQQQQQQQTAAAAVQSQRATTSDDEDDQEEDFDQQQQQQQAGHHHQTTTSSLYDSLSQVFAEEHRQQIQAANQHRHMLTGQHDPLAASNQDVEDGEEGAQEAGGAFLIDKNKKLFPQKLWELIHNPSIQHCLRWSQDGQRVYLNRNEFEQYYLKTANNQFHTQKAISFVRQMNMYGFRKVDDCYYENDNFRRDRKHLLKNMIRRHPNKGLFVGLDHHQLAAAAAAQQALQVNQQLQQLESQHKQRAEQALRLNNYLNQQQQSQLQAYGQYQTCAAGAMNLNTKSAHHLNAHHHHHPHHLPQLPPHSATTQHSSPFDQMSSQLVAQVAAASQFSQQQQQQVGENLVTKNSPPASVTAGQAKHSPPPPPAPQAQQHPVSHQPKKSRLLSNFYQQEREKEQQLQLQQQLQEPANKHQHLNLSSFNNNSQQADLQAALNLNLGSPLGVARSELSVARTSQQHEQIREAKLAAHQMITSGCCNSSGSLSQQNQVALHETLVRSLLQLKQQQQNEHNNHRFDNDHHHRHHQPLTASSLVAALAQQQQQRTLLESLASLSSGGTGSIVDPASNSPTERTATPPSGPPSPRHSPGGYHDTGPMALNLAKSSTSPEFSKRPQAVGSTTKPDGPEEKGEEGEADEDYAIQVDDDNNDCRVRRTGAMDNEMAGSPLDATKKVRKFLEDQMQRLAAGGTHHDDNDDSNDGAGSRGRRSIKREACSSDEEEADAEVDPRPTRSFKKQRKIQSSDEDEQQDLNFISKLLVSEICNRRGRGHPIDELALDEAAKYTQCFLGVLIDDASHIAGHSGNSTGAKSEGEASISSGISAKDEDDTTQDQQDLQDEQQAGSESCEAQASGGRQKKSSTSGAGNQDEPIDVSSLSLALRLIPSKLIAAVQAASCGAGKPQRVHCEPLPPPQAIEPQSS